jgi:hypothetical protein
MLNIVLEIHLYERIININLSIFGHEDSVAIAKAVLSFVNLAKKSVWSLQMDSKDLSSLVLCFHNNATR